MMFGEKSSSTAFEVMSYLHMQIQISAVLFWVWAKRPAGLCFDTKQLELLPWLGAAILCALGLALRNKAKRAIGRENFYYGSRFYDHLHRNHHKKSSVKGWPFNLFPHPEYVGSMCLVWAPIVALNSQLPEGSAFVAIYMSTLFAACWIMEDYLD
jgi:hypothetical protein